MVQFFLDTASLNEIEVISRQGITEGVTTNQKIFLTEGKVDFKRRILDICRLVKGPVSVETTKRTTSEILAQAREFASWHKNIVVKVAMHGDGRGLEVVHQLTKEKIRTNMTVMMTFNQLVLASKAGATYVSLFYNRAIEAHENPLQIIRDYASLARENEGMARLIVGSIRKPEDVALAVAAGAHIMTVPFKILKQMPYNKRTEETIEEFDKAWEEFQSMKNQPIAH
ncbi:MAG TPA: transaldolase family protein [Nitrososphaerales archaeon]|nr:transaldolase family protein [Nitrososphaerales archaeon]HUK74978.1 transaldolase family protein [Nitrososphaerales archaeon]